MSYNLEKFLSTLSKACDELDIDKSTVVISHGGASVLWGIKDITDDIDVYIPKETFELVAVESEIIHRPSLGTETPVDSWFYVMSDGEVDFHRARDTDVDKDIISMHGFGVTSKKQMLIDYSKLNRDKDQETLKWLRDSLNE